MQLNVLKSTIVSKPCTKCYNNMYHFFFREKFPSHFKFKEYCPLVFRKLREDFNIDDQAYAVSTYVLVIGYNIPAGNY